MKFVKDRCSWKEVSLSAEQKKLSEDLKSIEKQFFKDTKMLFYVFLDTKKVSKLFFRIVTNE